MPDRPNQPGARVHSPQRAGDRGPAILVVTNLPDSASAFNLARQLVGRRLAACVNVLAAATSFYRWDGKLEEAAEHPVLIKSTHERYPELEAAIRSLHPYSLPEIVALPIEAGLPAYLDWVEAETRVPGAPAP